MDRGNLQRYKQLLLVKLDELSARPVDTAFRTPGAGGLVGDFADQATADAEAELHIQVHRSDAHLLRAIEDALARISHGRYGACEVCKLPISKPRLEAVPWTRHCRDCKERESA